MSIYPPGTKSLTQFKSFIPQQVFKTTQTYPDFFNTYLVDPLRIIKIFKDDPNGLQRIFYFQYLLLCEENAEGYPEIRADNMRQLLNSPQFKFIFPSDSHQFPYTDSQFKRLALQFLDLIQHSQINIEQAISKYPIIDLVFTYLMRTLLIINFQAQQSQQFIDKNQLFSVLTKIFDIQIENVGKCTKFTQSEVFVYQQSPFQIYMVYLQDQPQQKQFEKQKQITPTIVINQLQNIKRTSKKQKDLMYKSNTSNNQGYDFVDYTGFNIEKINNNNLFQSQNLSLRSHFKAKQKQLPKKQFSKKQISKKSEQSNPSDHLYVGEVQQKLQSQQQALMEIKVAQANNNKQVRNQKNNIKQSFVPFQEQSQYSDFQSNDNEPKIQVMLPASMNLQKTAESTQLTTIANSEIKNSLRSNQINSKTSIQQKYQEIKQGKSGINIYESYNDMYPPNQQRFVANTKSEPKIQQKSINKYQFDTFFQKQPIQQNFLTNLGNTKSQPKIEQKVFNDYQFNSIYQKQTIQPKFLGNIKNEPKFEHKVTNNYQFDTFYQKQLPFEQKFKSNNKIQTQSLTNNFVFKQQKYSKFQPINQRSKLKQLFSDYKEPTYNIKKPIPVYKDKTSFLNTQYKRTQKINSNLPVVKLNVTQQFTNSFIMKQLPEPYRQNVWKVRQRARAYRKSQFQMF